MKLKNKDSLEMAAEKFTEWIGSLSSIILHTILFIAAFGFILFGAGLEKVLLVLTTVVSLEAIYLALFIQMTVNRNTESLENVEEDLEEIEKDIDEIGKDVDAIEKDIDEIEKDVDEIESHDSKEHAHDQQMEQILSKIQSDLADLAYKIEQIKK